MKKNLVLILLLVSFVSNAQKSAEDEPKGNVVFKSNTPEEGGKSKLISYSGFAVEYVIPNYSSSLENNAFTSSGFAINIEAYRPLSKKIALATNVSFVFLDQLRNEEFNLGLYFILLKGFYVKPQVGIGFYGSGDKGVQDYLTSTFNYTLRGQAGYLFKIGGSGNKQSFLDLGFALHTINNPILTTNYYGISLKYLWGTK